MLQDQDHVYFRHSRLEPPREAFFRHWPLRRRWLPLAAAAGAAATAAAGPGAATTNINVCARFRPLSIPQGEADKENHRQPADPDGVSSNEPEEGANGEAAVMPLHQRLQLLRKHYKCSTQEALRRLWGGGRGEYDFFRDATVAEPGSDPAEDDGPAMLGSGNASAADGHVASAEAPAGEAPTSEADSAGAAMSAMVQMGVLAVRPEQRELLIWGGGTAGIRRFQFDAVLDDGGTQQQLYQASGAPVVQDYINGVNGLIMAYGQTGSGKTFSLFGPSDEAATRLRHLHPAAGVAPRALAEVLAAVDRRRQHGLAMQLKLTVVEIFGDHMVDLLQDRAQVGAWHGVAARALASEAVAVGKSAIVLGPRHAPVG